MQQQAQAKGLDPKTGRALAKGSKCIETEVTSINNKVYYCKQQFI